MLGWIVWQLLVDPGTERHTLAVRQHRRRLRLLARAVTVAALAPQWFAAGLVVAVTLPISLIDIWRHLSNYRDPSKQRWVIRILLMVCGPVSSLGGGFTGL